MPSRSRQVRRAEARRAQAKKATRSSQGGGGGPDLREKVPKLSKSAWLAAGVVVVAVVAVIAVVSLGSSSSSSSESSLLTGSGYPNGDTSNTRYTQGPIDSANVSQLQPAWTLPLTAKSQYGSYSASPIISRRGDVLPGPGLERAGDQPEDRQGDLEQDLRIARPGTERPGRRGRAGVWGDRDGGVRAGREDRRTAVVGHAGAQRTRGHRHGAGIPQRHRLRLDGAGEQRKVLRRRRRGHPVGAGSEHGKEAVALRHRA